MRAWELHQHGWKQKDIATALGVTQGAVSQWVKRRNNGGVPALRPRTASRCAPRLSIEQREQLRVAHLSGEGGAPPGEAFLAEGGAQRLWMEQLPRYAPEMSSAEGICQYLKRVC